MHRRGGTVAFNLLARDGSPLDYRAVEAAATRGQISLRGGCFCNPGAGEAALGLSPADVGALFREVEQPTVDALRARLPGRAVGAVRVSLGIATTPRDIDRLIELLRTFATDQPAGASRDQTARASA
jgi:selenocysteine lyase/cysteine desulfurase